MSKRIELGDDKYVEVREVGELTAGDRRAAKAAVKVELDPATGNQLLPGDYNERMNLALAARIVTTWNLQWPLPKGNPSVFDKLTMDQLDTLLDGIEEHVDAINKKAVDPTAEGSDPTAA